MIDVSKELVGVVVCPYKHPVVIENISDKIEAAKKELKELISCSSGMVKQEYLQIVENKRREIQSLVVENHEIQKANEDAKRISMVEHEAERKELEKLDENIWAAIRIKRNVLLAESDWTQLLDSPLSEDKIHEWAVYRQKLRDLPQDFPNHSDAQLPKKPE